MHKENTQNSPWRWLFPALLIAGLPILAVTAYSHFFSTGSGPQSTTANEFHLDPIVAETHTAGNSVAPVDELTDRLAARLQTSPDDPSGWLLLAQSYAHLQKLEQAREAYSKALHYGASNTELAKRLGVAGEGQ